MSIENSSISIEIIIFIVFLILKLTHTIDWSWWWITCPLWISLVLFLVFCGLIFIFISLRVFLKRQK
jgi:hypothetical protein